jgi:hypothetical protein
LPEKIPQRMQYPRLIGFEGNHSSLGLKPWMRLRGGSGGGARVRGAALSHSHPLQRSPQDGNGVALQIAA